MSLGAVVGMTLPVARNPAQHLIRVCTIAPGIITPMLNAVTIRRDGAIRIPPK